MGMVKREIFAKEILNDIKSGMDDVNLMQKYRVTVKGLDSVFQKLLAAGLVSERELNSRKLGFEETVDLSGLFALAEQGGGQVRERKKKEYSYSGMVEGIDILDYIQWILLDRRSTVLEIGLPNGTSCSVYLKEGEIIHAVNHELEGEEALYTSVMFPSGRFGHETWTEPDRKTIKKPGTQLLLEAARRRDEADS
ncbi:MAG: DUF4388 domain-containing protein [Desulfomonilaceae bacterium]